MRLVKRIEDIMNDFSIKKKLTLIYIFCVIFPLVVTDSIVFLSLYNAEKNEQSYEMKNIADAVQYNMKYSFEESANIINDIYVSRTIIEFLDVQYEDAYAFFDASQELQKISSLDRLGGYDISNLVVYADNETIVNGGHFYRLSQIQDEEWYDKFVQSGRNMTLSFYYIGDKDLSALSKRRISLVRSLDYYNKEGCKKIVRLDIDYNSIARKILDKGYSYGIYLCEGDRILFSNRGHSGSNEDFKTLTGEEQVSYKSSFDLYGEKIDILIMKQPSSVIEQVKEHLPIILFLITINLFLPVLMVAMINRSFTMRLRQLGKAFDEARKEGSLQETENVRGKDEIGILMRNYNVMVNRINDLIQTVYKDRLEKQEIDLARQNAELLAMHSQINPHFLFNVLESIRMHCILQKEEKTAEMIEKLAILERQNINWAADRVMLKEEMNFTKAYLELQKYRFGARLQYEIDLQKDCEEYYIPKLTLTTFVENSCVHGMEKKTSTCWIYVRIYKKNKWLYLEVEDTGGGMEEEDVARMNDNMRCCNVDDIKQNEHVGIVNACLRLKMISDGNVEFTMESEKGIGTFMTIKVDSEFLVQEQR